MDAIGLVGVGYIGTEFLDRLLAREYDVAVFDIDDESVARATEQGATAVDSPAAVATDSDAVVLALPGSPEVAATLESADGHLEAPITGGAPREGYQMMIGGTPERYKRAAPRR